MSLHRNDTLSTSLTRCLRPRRLPLIAAVLGALTLLPTPVRADDPMTPAQIEQRINELASRGDLTDAEMEELVELGQRYSELMEKGTTGEAATAQPEPTPAPAAPTPRPTAGRRAGRQPTPTPAPTPTPRPSRSRAGRAPRPTPAPTPAPAAAPGAAPGAPGGEALEVARNIAAEQYLKPYDEREYMFSMKDATYAELIENFGRQASLPVIGTAPAGSVTFVSADVMDFKTALGRVQMLLFKHPDQYWLDFKKDKNYLEIVRMVDIKRYIPLNRIYVSLAEYRAADLDDNEIAMLLYTPESGSIGELEPLRDFMPDYFMTAPYPDKNAQTIFGLVSDINKYLDLINKFGRAIDDPRQVKIIPIQHVKPSAALEMLQQLVDFGPTGAGATPSQRRGSQPSQAQVMEYGVTAIASDERGTLLVRAMPKKIEEIESFLQYVDIPLEGGEYTPVVVRVEHANAGEVMNLVKSILGAGDSAATPAQPPSAAQRRRAARKAAAAGAAGATAAAPLSTDALTMLHWEPANSIILLGEDEEVAEAKELIARFDVAEDVDTRFIEVKNRAADEMCTLATALLTATRGGEAPSMTCTPEASGSRLILAGPTREVEQANELITKLDIEDTGEDDNIHTVVLECMKPSEIVNLLSVWDTATPTAAPAPAARPKRGRAPRRPATATAAGSAAKFVADDASRSLRVVSTDTDWQERYEPMIARLDREACGGVEHVVLEVTHIDPAEAVGTLTTFFGAKAPAGPTMLPVARGVMVMGATSAELDTMKQVLAEVDVDPVDAGLIERRTFELENVEAAEILPVLQALIGGGAGPAPAPRRGRGQPAAAATASAGVTFVESGNRLWVSAPPADMQRIADLVAELDVPEAQRDLRPYDFEPGVNVTELAETLRQLFPENARVAAAAPAAPANRRGRRVARSAGAASGGADGDSILFIPQPAARRIFVSAPVDMFPEIEQTIELVRPESGPQGKVVVNFYPLEKADPQYAAELIEPIAQMRIAELIEAGELPAPAKDGTLLRITPDPAAKRVIVAAPSAVIPEIEDLIAKAEAGEQADIVTELVTLKNASAVDMADTISKMIGAGGSASARPMPAAATPGRRGSRGRAAAAAAMAAATAGPTTTPSGVTVVPLKSNDTLLVRGPRADVDEVKGWIEMLDNESNIDTQMRVYQPMYADVEKLADDIMTVIDPGGGAAAPKPAASEDDDLFGFDSLLSFGGPRRGQEIRLTTNTLSNTMVVWASPRKLSEIDRYIDLYESGDVAVQEELPSKTIELKYVDAYDAQYKLEDYIDAIWSGDKPKITYVPFTNSLVIKSRKLEEDLPRIEEILAQHIDTPDKAGASIKVEHQAVTGGPVDQVVAELLMRVGDQVDIEIDGDLAAEKPDVGLKRLTPSREEPRDITPCVLPVSLTRALDALAASALAQADGAAAPSDANTSGAGAAVNDLMRARLADEAAAPKATPAPTPTAVPAPTPAPAPANAAPAATPAPAAEAPAADALAKPKVKIRIDRYNNSVTITGPPRAVEDVKDKIDDILEDLQDVAGGPDIRVWQLEYVDPNVASQVLESMFGASSPRTQAANAAAALRAAQLQQRALQQQQQRAANQKQGQNQAGGEDGGKGNERGRGERGGEEQQQPEIPQIAQPQGGMTVFPYPALHAIIIKAPTEMYPAIEELVATIDRPTPAGTEFEYFPIHSQAASAVEDQLKVIFNIEQQGGANRRTPTRGRAQNPAAQQVEALMQQTLDLAALGEEASSLGSTASITITSNDQTNTVLVRGPRPVLDLAKEIIEEIEAHAPPAIETRMFPLKYADSAKVVPQLKELFPPGKPEDYHPDRVQATFLANTLNNEVVVQARVVDFERIASVIERLDTKSDEGDQAVTVGVACGDAEKFAKLLGQVYGMGRGNKESGKKVEFVGDAASNTVVFTAPPEMREDITNRINSLDQMACDLLEPHFITLENANATQVAKVIEEAFSPGRGEKRVRVAGDDATRKLIVTCPADLYPQIETFAKTLDVPPQNLDVRTYTLKFAKATETLQQMEQMFRALAVQMKGQNQNAFAGTASDRSNTITVAGTPLTFVAVEKFLADFDTPSQDTTTGTMVVALTKTDATEVANMIRRLFPRAENGIEPPRAEANDRTNTLVVIGTQGQRDRIQNEVISKLEEIAGPQQERETRVFPITYADLNDMRNSITTAFRQERGENESERVDVAVENATRSLVVTAKPNKLTKVETLIGQLDKDSGVSTVTRRTYEMKQGKASQVADILNRTIRETRRGNQGPPLSVVANDDLNVIVVTSTQKEYDEMLPLIEQLDQAPAEGNLVIKVYSVEYADPGSLIQTINNSFPRLPGQRPEDVVRASYTYGTSSLVVAASDKNHERVAKILSEIDVASSQARTTHVIPLQQANAEELAQRLTNILSKTQRQRRDDAGMAVVADPATNSLLVFASEAELAKVQELVTTLDVQPSFSPDIKSFKLTYAEAWPTREAIVELFGKARGGRLKPQDEVSVVVDWGSNSVVVSASKAKMADIEKFITQIDQSGQGSRQVRVVRLQQADPAGVVRSLQEMFVRRDTRGQETVSISNPQGSDAILIKANDKEFAQIEPVIASLDVMPDDKNRAARMFTLKYTNADEMQAIVEDYLARPGNNGGRRGGASDLIGDVRITPIPSNNSIVATGSVDAVDRVAALVERIDVEVEGAGNAPKIIHLQKALASDIEPTLTQLFVEQAGQRRGSGRGAGSAAQITPVIVANDYANTLIVRASPADYAAIENLAMSLDAEESDPSSRFKIVQLASAFRAAELAPTIQDTVSQAAAKPGAAQGRGNRRGGQSEFTVQAIEASNSLALAGDPKQIQVAMAMIEQIQAMGPAGGKVSKIIPLGNRDPEEIKRVIDEMINNNKSQGTSSRGGRTRRR